MATHGEWTAEIDATPERCCEVLTDYERLPEWRRAVPAARVFERDEQGHGSVAWSSRHARACSPTCEAAVAPSSWPR